MRLLLNSEREFSLVSSDRERGTLQNVADSATFTPRA